MSSPFEQKPNTGNNITTLKCAELEHLKHYLINISNYNAAGVGILGRWSYLYVVSCSVSCSVLLLMRTLWWIRVVKYVK